MHHRPHNRLIKFAIIILLASVFSLAWSLDSDKYEVMHIISDTATYDRDHHLITYEGKVQANQGTSNLDGDKLVVYQMPDDKNKIQQVIVYGNPAHYSTLPELNKARLYVEALKITYDPNKKTVLLEGKGRVNQEGNIFTGPHIWYDMVNGIVHSSTTGSQERTEVIIQPQESPPKK